MSFCELPNPLRVLILGAVLLTACSRVTQDEGGSGSVSIQIPSAEKLQAMGKVGAFSVIDTAKLCFGVNVIGPGIKTSPAGSCDVARGIVAGTVPAGGTLTVEVDVGDDRVFEVYGFMRGSAGAPCPVFSKAAWGYPVTQIYSLGKSSPTKVSKEGASVDIAVTLPDESDTIVAQLGWAPSCANVGGGGSSPGARISAGAEISTGTTLKVSASVSGVAQGQVSQGATLKTRGWRIGN